MSTPVILPASGTPLYRQIQAYLATDTNPTAGIVPALGNATNSIYPNYLTGGPSANRTGCPVPFLIVTPGAVRARDYAAREGEIVVEIHDDPDFGEQRSPGIVQRLLYWLCQTGWRPTSDTMYTYTSGLMFHQASPPNLPDQRYGTMVQQLVFLVYWQDRTSYRGFHG